MSNNHEVLKTFKCPHCNHDKGVLRTTAEKERSEGLLDKEEPVAINHSKILLADDSQINSGSLAGKKLRMMHFYTDLCGKCGTQYVYRVTIHDYIMPALPKIQHGPQIAMPGGMIPPNIKPPGKNN